jgi:hypothetical protein
MLRISWVAPQLAASQEGLSSISKEVWHQVFPKSNKFKYFIVVVNVILFFLSFPKLPITVNINNHWTQAILIASHAAELIPERLYKTVCYLATGHCLSQFMRVYDIRLLIPCLVCINLACCLFQWRYSTKMLHTLCVSSVLYILNESFLTKLVTILVLLPCKLAQAVTLVNCIRQVPSLNLGRTLTLLTEVCCLCPEFSLENDRIILQISQ